MSQPEALPGGRRRNPWWIPPFLGRVPAEVPDVHVKLLGALAFAIYFENFDQALLTQAIKQIAADFGVAEQQLGAMLGWVRLGAVPAFLLVPFADRIGRRRLFLVSVLGMSFFTTAAGLSFDAIVFVGCQMFARMFMVTAAATAFVIISEELAASQRGWGIGILGAVGAFGVGLAAALFAAIEILPWGWRTMYALGILPVLLFPWLRRRVTETARFTRHQSTQAQVGLMAGWFRPLANLLREQPARAAAIALIGFAQTASVAAVYNFSAYFVQVAHGWEPRHYALLLGVAGVGGVLGHPFAGRMADRRGRRTVGVALLTLFPLLALLFYRGPEWLVPVAWVPMIFTLTGGETIIRALATELFPTSLRGTASGWLQMTSTLGAAAGLFGVTLATPEGGSAIPAVQGIALCAWIAALVIWFLPETGGRELEEISA